MNIVSLNETEKRVIIECLHAAVKGPFIPDWEFETLIGFSPKEIQKVAMKQVEPINAEEITALQRVLGNLLYYPIDQPNKWADYISASKECLIELFEKIK